MIEQVLCHLRGDDWLGAMYYVSRRRICQMSCILRCRCLWIQASARTIHLWRYFLLSELNRGFCKCKNCLLLYVRKPCDWWPRWFWASKTPINIWKNRLIFIVYCAKDTAAHSWSLPALNVDVVQEGVYQLLVQI